MWYYHIIGTLRCLQYRDTINDVIVSVRLEEREREKERIYVIITTTVKDFVTYMF